MIAHYMLKKTSVSAFVYCNSYPRNANFISFFSFSQIDDICLFMYLQRDWHFIIHVHLLWFPQNCLVVVYPDYSGHQTL